MNEAKLGGYEYLDTTEEYFCKKCNDSHEMFLNCEQIALKQSDEYKKRIEEFLAKKEIEKWP